MFELKCFGVCHKEQAFVPISLCMTGKHEGWRHFGGPRSAVAVDTTFLSIFVKRRKVPLKGQSHPTKMWLMPIGMSIGLFKTYENFLADEAWLI